MCADLYFAIRNFNYLLNSILPSFSVMLNRVSGKRRLADSAGNTEFRILRLNYITCGMFIAPRDVSNKIDGGEGSYGTSDTEYSGAERSSSAKKYVST